MTDVFTAKQRQEIFHQYDDAVATAIMDGDNSTGHVKEIASGYIRKSIRAGKLPVDIESLIIHAAWESASDRSATNTTKLIKEIIDKQTALDIETLLDSPITVGNSRRTLVRFLTKEDWGIIVDIREKNKDDATSVYNSAVNAQTIVVPMLDAYGDMEAAIKSGGLMLTAPVVAAAV